MLGAANARRIVACVNSCAGITTAQLERLPVGDFTKKLIQGIISATEESAQLHSHAADLQAQVDELLAALGIAKSALERCYDVTDWPCNGNTDQDKAIATAAAVINKITGEPK